MTTLIARRLAQLVPTVLLLSIIIFSLQHLLPGDPALVLAGENPDEATLAAIREAPGLGAEPRDECRVGDGCHDHRVPGGELREHREEPPCAARRVRGREQHDEGVPARDPADLPGD